MTPESEFLEALQDLIAEFEDDLGAWDCLVLTQAYCLRNVMRLSEVSREMIGRKVGEVAAQMEGRMVH